MSLLRLGYKRHFHLGHSLSFGSAGLGQASFLVASSSVERPMWEGTEPLADGHVGAPSWKWFPQPQSSLQAMQLQLRS